MNHGWLRAGARIKLKDGSIMLVTESDQFTTTGIKHEPDALVNELSAVDNEEIEEVLVMGSVVYRRGKLNPPRQDG